MDKKVFMDLHLRTQSAPISIRNTILDQVRKPWRHHAERESSVKEHAVGHQDEIVLIRDASADIGACSLVLVQEQDGYKVANIVSMHLRELDVKTCNAILQDFVSRIVVSAAQIGGFTVDLSELRDC